MTSHPTAVLREPLDVSVEDLRRRLGRWNAPAFLEGGSEFGRSGRWSFYAANPRRIFESVDGTSFRWHGGKVELEIAGDALEGLQMVIDRHGLSRAAEAPAADGDAPPFRGGLIGYLSYDLSPRIEPTPRKSQVARRFPVAWFGLYDTFVAVDHHRRSVEIWAVDLSQEGPGPLRTRVEAWRRHLRKGGDVSALSSNLGSVEASWSAARYREQIDRAIEYLRAGDIFQVNIAQRFVARGKADPLRLYHHLRAVSRSPYGAFLCTPDWAVLSSSPELFFETIGGSIVTRPIKGTRPRSPDLMADRARRDDLVASEKDLAELRMIVDLERNDLGKICEFGSVQVVEPRQVETFPQVHHTVATIEGTLQAEARAVDVIRAMFPGGSITGAPKIRAMEIIDELEDFPREVYTGAIGYLGVGGNATFNIAIRTMLVDADGVQFHAGGGIVIDSDPDQEYRETLDKAAGMLEALRLEGASR